MSTYVTEEDRQTVIDYMGLDADATEPLDTLKDINWKFNLACMNSVADYCILPMQDVLGLSSESRTNIPSTVGNNWKWRIKKDAFNDEVIDRLKNLTRISGRL